jgi:integrase
MNFENLFNHYTKSPSFEKLSVKTRQSYMYGARQLEEFFGDTEIDTIKRSHFIRFQESLAKKPATANVAVRVASIVFAYAVDVDLVPFNPVARMKKLKIGSHVRWDIDEVKKIILLDDRKISTATALAWYTGQREGDILGMRWKDFSEGYISMTQEKTGVELAIKAHPDLVAYLNGIRGNEPDDYYIVSGKKKMNSSAFRNMFRRRTDKAGINKVFHGIRKGVASNLAENGRPISEIAALMGHKSMRMAAYYAEQASGKKLTESAVSNLSSCLTP